VTLRKEHVLGVTGLRVMCLTGRVVRQLKVSTQDHMKIIQLELVNFMYFIASLCYIYCLLFLVI